MESLVGVVLTDVIFIALALFINKENSTFLLSGYNTMTAEERAHFDIDNFLKFFKKFFLYLAISSTILYVLLYYWVDQKIALIGYACFLCIMLIGFVIKGNTFTIK